MNKTVTHTIVFAATSLAAVTIAYKLGKREGCKETFEYVANDFKNIMTEHLKDKSPAN